MKLWIKKKTKIKRCYNNNTMGKGRDKPKKEKKKPKKQK